METPEKRLRIRTYEPSMEASLFAQRVAVRRSVASHDHDFWEIVLVTAGRSEHRTLYGRRLIQRGDVLVIGPRQWHAYEQCRGLIVWNCGIGERLLKSELAWTVDDPVLGMLWRPGDESQRGLVEGRCIEQIMRQAQGALEKVAGAKNQAERLGWLLVFLGMVAPVLGQTSRRSEKRAPIHPAVRRVAEAMRGDLAGDWSLDRMALIGRVNRSYLVRLFRKHTGQSPMAMLLKMRCERAAALLIETDRPVGWVGMQVGWPDANYFGRRFRSHFGRTPTAMRAGRRQG